MARKILRREEDAAKKGMMNDGRVKVVELVRPFEVSVGSIKNAIPQY